MRRRIAIHMKDLPDTDRQCFHFAISVEINALFQ